jgi:hypothetical protein
MSARGVTHDSARDAELGAGKWTESARPLEELSRDLPKSPTRTMELDAATAATPWGLLVAVGVLVGIVGIATVSYLRSHPTAVAAPETATLRTVPDGAEVLVDGRTLGVAPVQIVLPEKAVEVCAVWAGDRHCKTLGRADLAAGFTFERPAR